MRLQSIHSRVLRWICGLIGLVVLAGCSKQAPSSEITVPQEEKFPYKDFDYRPIAGEPWTSTRKWPGDITLLRDYLDAPAGLSVDTLDFSHGGDIDLEVLNDGRLVILDLDRNELLEYDPYVRTARVIASRGAGPGELRFPQDMMRIDSRVFIARADQQISVFDCSGRPCSFSGSIQTDDAVHALSATPDAGFALIASVSGQTGSHVDAAMVEHNPPAVTVIDSEGRVASEFGERYDIDGHWMLARPFHADGSITYVPAISRFLVTFAAFPHLFLYGTDGELMDGFRVDDFTIGEWTYNTEGGRLTNPRGDVSSITSVSLAGTDAVVIEVRHRTDMSMVDQRWVFRLRKDFYAIDLDTGESVLIGSVSGDHESPVIERIFLDGDRLFVNAEGRLVEVEK